MDTYLLREISNKDNTVCPPVLAVEKGGGEILPTLYILDTLSDCLYTSSEEGAHEAR